AFVIDRRVKRAQQLLTIGDLAVKEVAASCGFADQAHMTRVLRARLGLTPAKLRASRRS
ncbi:MAG: helix-turn-helix domain-containing protein, partial [Methyloversatilis sp.]|nr:helix-turn-helix domain-containing protein [Methyloversatilis sp.]